MERDSHGPCYLLSKQRCSWNKVEGSKSIICVPDPDPS